MSRLLYAECDKIAAKWAAKFKALNFDDEGGTKEEFVRELGEFVVNELRIRTMGDAARIGALEQKIGDLCRMLENQKAALASLRAERDKLSTLVLKIGREHLEDVEALEAMCRRLKNLLS